MAVDHLLLGRCSVCSCPDWSREERIKEIELEKDVRVPGQDTNVGELMTNRYANEEYYLNLHISWKLKANTVSEIKCERCNGKGRFGGGFGWYDEDDNTCDTCRGSGKVKNPELTDMPSIPKDLWEHMKKEFQAFGKNPEVIPEEPEPVYAGMSEDDHETIRQDLPGQ